MKNTNIIAIIFCFCLCTTCAKDVVDLSGSIRGVVKDFQYGQLITNCQISINPTGRSTMTSAAGAYEFTDLEPGEYTLTFNRAGYEQEVTTVSVVAGQITENSILLKSKSPFSISESVLDFGDLKATETIYFYNNSNSDCSYSISNVPTWLNIDKREGTIKGGSFEIISLQINREIVDWGSYSQTILINYSGPVSGTASLLVIFDKVLLQEPTVTCASAPLEIGSDHISISGEISQTGGAQITAYGHCWSTTPDPTIADEKTLLGTTEDTGPFISDIYGLLNNTVYYIRAYATNSVGTSYSRQIQVTTDKISIETTDPKVITSSASDITTNSAKLQGSIQPGSESIIEYGFYYGTSSDPTMRLKVASSSIAGSYSGALTSLQSGATYYYKAYARTAKGFYYGGVLSFTTSSIPSFMNYSYTITSIKSNRGYKNETDDVTYDFYTEFDSHGEAIIEAGFITADFRDESFYNGYHAKVLQCEVINNSIHYYRKDHLVGTTYMDSGGYSESVRPYIIIDSGIYYGIEGYAFDNGYTNYSSDDE